MGGAKRRYGSEERRWDGREEGGEGGGLGCTMEGGGEGAAHITRKRSHQNTRVKSGYRHHCQDDFIS